MTIQILAAMAFVAGIFLVLFTVRTKQKDEAAIKKLQNSMELAREREMRRLESKPVRAYDPTEGHWTGK